MGAKLTAYYKLAEEKGGLPMQMRLAMKTLMAAEKAARRAGFSRESR